MLTLSAVRMAEVTGGELVTGSPDAMANSVCIDSRGVVPGCAFVAIIGARVDGHSFIGDVLRDGARVLIVTRWDEELQKAFEDGRRRDVAVVRVPDAAAALAALAGYRRARLACPVVGITGSTGKTTTKDFLAAALSTKLRVTATAGNRNNELGVPLTVLSAGAETDVLVVELAMRGPGQIGALCEIARPTLGLVTNVGQTHMEILGSQEAIVHAKGELVDCIPADGAVFLNGDDVWSRRLADRSAAPVVYYGLDEGNDVRAVNVVTDEAGRPSMTITVEGEAVDVSLPVPGRHNAYNAASAAAVALHLGLSLDDVAAGLASTALSEWRMQVFTAANGVTVVNDAYNANPTSMRAALAALRDMRADARRVAVLGDMAELGSLSDLAHFKLGEDVGQGGIDVLVSVGHLARRIAEGAKATGMDPGSIVECGSAAEAVAQLAGLVEAGDIVLVKASRSMGLETVVEGIVHPDA